MSTCGGGGCSFSLDHYRDILGTATELGYPAMTFAEFFDHEPEGPALLLRHDIDVAIEPAAAVAAVERELGVRSTYFFRVAASGYRVSSPEAVALAADLSVQGAETALHSDALFADDDPQEALCREKQALEAAFETSVRGVSFHLPRRSRPVSDVDVGAAGFAYEAGAEAFNRGTAFFSDSNQCWNSGCVCGHLGPAGRLYIAIHPIWWVTDAADAAGVIARIRGGE